MNKLPKQFKDWAAGAKLKVHFKRKRKSSGWFYLKGRGYVWRVNCHFEFERGDTYADFDRWALCNIDSVPLPKTKQEFIAAVKHLVSVYSEDVEE